MILAIMQQSGKDAVKCLLKSTSIWSVYSILFIKKPLLNNVASVFSHIYRKIFCEKRSYDQRERKRLPNL